MRIYEYSHYRLPQQPVEKATALGIELPQPLLDLLATLADTLAATLAVQLDTAYPPDAPRAAATKELVS
jgi:membrane protein